MAPFLQHLKLAQISLTHQRKKTLLVLFPKTQPSLIMRKISLFLKILWPQAIKLPPLSFLSQLIFVIVVCTHSRFYFFTFNLLFSLYSLVLALIFHWFVFGSLLLANNLSLATYKGHFLVFDSLDYSVAFNIVVILEICYSLGFYPVFPCISLVTFFLSHFCRLLWTCSSFKCWCFSRLCP